MAFAEDFAVFTNPDDFGTAASVTRLAGAVVSDSVDGIFDAEYEGELNMEGAGPMFACAAADLPGVKHDDELTIDGVDYLVKGVQPDGTGWLRLILELADG
jgi:hypothetical protein